MLVFKVSGREAVVQRDFRASSWATAFFNLKQPRDAPEDQSEWTGKNVKK
jgi:hypothetical protein